MQDKTVKEIMIPIDEYATIQKDAKLIDAIKTLEMTREKTLGKKHHYRAVLVVDNDGEIIGKIGYLSFLKAMEPNYNDSEIESAFRKANLDSDFIDSMMDNFSLWQDDLLDICNRANNVTVTEAMIPVEQKIDANASIIDAMHKLIVWNTMSILVYEKNMIIGIIRLSDVYEEMVNYIKNTCTNNY